MNKKRLNTLLILITILIIIIFNVISTGSNKSSSLDKIKNKNIISIVNKKYIDYNNHSIPYIVFNNDSIIAYREWVPKIETGDSIIKPKGSLTITVKNPNKVLIFNYEDMKDSELPNP